MNNKLEALGWSRYPSDMAASWEQLAEQAMTLSSESRARLADRLVESLDVDEPGAVDHLWVSEAKRRRDEVRTGQVQPINGEEALSKVRDHLSREPGYWKHRLTEN